MVSLSIYILSYVDMSLNLWSLAKTASKTHGSTLTVPVHRTYSPALHIYLDFALTLALTRVISCCLANVIILS